MSLADIVLQFRGWLDSLLKSSWDACQGTNVLIESPVAMAGIHVAEALRIPYCEHLVWLHSETTLLSTLLSQSARSRCHGLGAHLLVMRVVYHYDSLRCLLPFLRTRAYPHA